MKFDWDQDKNKANIIKHSIDFEEAKTVFDDVFAVIIEDHFHSNLEQREIIVGQSSNNRLLYVVFIERKDRIRIISARLLTSGERRRYEQGYFSI